MHCMDIVSKNEFKLIEFVNGVSLSLPLIAIVVIVIEEVGGCGMKRIILFTYSTKDD